MAFDYEEGVPLTAEQRRLFGEYQRPLPEFALSVVPKVSRPKVSPEERQRRVAELNEKVKDGVLRIQRSDEFRRYLIFMSHFHTYSWHNQMLIMLQKPDATLVRGWVGWKELGRSVKKGETGIRILAPQGPTSNVVWERVVNGARWEIRRIGDEWGVYESGRVVRQFKTKRGAEQWLRDQGAVPKRQVVRVTSFDYATIFDISQTEGKPVPEFKVPTLTGAMNKDLFDSTMALLSRKGVTVSFESRPRLDPDIKGMFQAPALIWVRPEEPPAQQLKTLLHEAAHYYTVGIFGMPRADAETIAESAAFVVGAHHGFDTGIRTFPYVALWAKDEKTLNKNMEGVHNVAEHILEELEGVEVAEPKRPLPEPPKKPPPEPPPSDPLLTVDQMEATYSLDQLKRMAREAGVSPSGSKRDIIRAIISTRRR